MLDGRVVVTPGVDEFLLLACDGVWEMMNTTQGIARQFVFFVFFVSCCLSRLSSCAPSAYLVLCSHIPSSSDSVNHLN